MRKLLLCLDPGKASGVGILDYSDLDNIEIVFSGELQPVDLYKWLSQTFYDAKQAGDSLECVAEDFLITPQTGKNSAAPWSLKGNGALELMCTLYEVPYTYQTPARAKNFVPNDRLKAVGLWHKGGEGHARDALRHGVLYLVEKKNWRPENLLVKD